MGNRKLKMIPDLFSFPPLAELYVLDRRDKKNGKLWLAKLRVCLKRHFDKHEFNVYKTLQKMIRAPRLSAQS